MWIGIQSLTFCQKMTMLMINNGDYNSIYKT